MWSYLSSKKKKKKEDVILSHKRPHWRKRKLENHFMLDIDVL